MDCMLKENIFGKKLKEKRKNNNKHPLSVFSELSKWQSKFVVVEAVVVGGGQDSIL